MWSCTHVFATQIPPNLFPPDQIPSWNWPYLIDVYFLFQSPHNGDDLSEGEGDVGSPEDELGHKVMWWFIYSNCDNKY